VPAEHGAVPGSLPSIVGNYKSLVTRRINNVRHTRGGKVWQRGYYERIVRNEREMNAIRYYIQANPERWAEDKDNLDALIGRMERIGR
jgi:REP element-mobilizing transposase RayT